MDSNQGLVTYGSKNGSTGEIAEWSRADFGPTG
jgi:hypothetical protein